MLELSGLGRYFRATVSSEEVPRGKPAPDVYLEACRRLGVEPARAAAVEDSHAGIAVGECGRDARDRDPEPVPIRRATRRSRRPTSSWARSPTSRRRRYESPDAPRALHRRCRDRRRIGDRSYADRQDHAGRDAQGRDRRLQREELPAAYAAYTAGFKARCPYANSQSTWLSSEPWRPRRSQYGSRSSRITGARATLTYDVLLLGQAVSSVTAASPDVFARINGLWYDDIDAQTTC